MIPTITLTDFPVYADYTYPTAVIRINLEWCYRLSLDRAVDFEEQVARCLNHEYLHHFLFEEHGVETTCAFDDLVWKAPYYDTLDYWMC